MVEKGKETSFFFHLYFSFLFSVGNQKESSNLSLSNSLVSPKLSLSLLFFSLLLALSKKVLLERAA